MKKTLKILVATPLLFSVYGYAEININGFASIVAGQTLSSDDVYLGYDDSMDFSPESLFAIQLSSDLGEGLGVTAQILAEGEDDWDPDFAWAYVSYDVNDELRILAGRQRVPLYMYSDYLDVSYAYSWITPPNGVYDVPFDSIDGVSFSYSTTLGEFDTNIQVIYGSNNDEDELLGETLRPDYEDVVGGAITLVRDWLTLRTGYFQADVTLPLKATQPLINGWQQAGFSEIADDILINEDTGTFIDFGFQIDYEDYLLIGEYTYREIEDTPLADEDSYYITGGKRFNDFLFTLTYGKDDGDIQNLTGDVPYGIAPELDFLKATTDGLTESSDDDSSYVTAGFRWDFHSSAALKFEYTSFSDDINDNNDADLAKIALVTVF